MIVSTSAKSTSNASFRRTSENSIAQASLLVVAAFLIFTLALPLWSLLSKSVQGANGEFVGLENFSRYFASPQLMSSLWNSLWIALATVLIVVPIAFTYAYALTRTRLPMKSVFTAIALLPLFAPSLLSSISLIYIFGNQGLLKSWVPGGSIYGPTGILLSQIFYCFPHAVLILTTALRNADARLYEAAEAMQTSAYRVFWTITLPGIKYGLLGAAIVVFTLVITDFGVAKVIGGQFNVLATDAYKQVVGQQNFQMGAVVGLVLLVPALLSFVADQLVRRRQVAQLTARAVPFEPKPNTATDTPATLFCIFWSAIILAIAGVAIWASFITYWPYNMTLSLKNYDFTQTEPNGWEPFFTSIRMAMITAIVGTIIVFYGAYLSEKRSDWPLVRTLIRLLAMLPMAVPGLVLGLGYIFFINAKDNPLGFLYGTTLLLALSSVAHFYTTAHVTAVSALKQIDAEIESISASMQVPFYRTFWRVTVPICLPTICDIAVYMFVNAMTTVSAVIFLYGANSKLASISIVHMDEAGASASAAAMATLIMATSLAVKLGHIALDRLYFNRYQHWRQR